MPQELAGLDPRNFAPPIRQILAGVAAHAIGKPIALAFYTVWVKLRPVIVSAVTAAFLETGQKGYGAATPPEAPWMRSRRPGCYRSLSHRALRREMAGGGKHGKFQGAVSASNCSNNGLNSRRGPSVPSDRIGSTL